MVTLDHPSCPTLLIIQYRVLDLMDTLPLSLWVLWQNQEQYHCQTSPKVHWDPWEQPSCTCCLVGLVIPTAHSTRWLWH